MNEKKTNDRKYILYILIVIFIASLSTLVYRVAVDIKEKNDEIKEQIRKEKEQQEKEQQAIKDKIQQQIEEAKKQQEEAKKQQEEAKKQREKESFNRNFEFYSGTIWKVRVSKLLDEVVTNNQKNKEHLIEVKYNKKSYGTDPNKIRSIKNVMPKDDFTEYEVSLDYNSLGYVNKVIIERR